jgi:hypothetical protein
MEHPAMSARAAILAAEEFLYSFQPFKRPALRKVVQLSGRLEAATLEYPYLPEYKGAITRRCLVFL